MRSGPRVLCLALLARALRPPRPSIIHRRRVVRSGVGDEDYTNPVTAFLGRFMASPAPVLDGVDFDAPKTPMSTPALAKAIDAGLREREWFVTGRVRAELFADDFAFEDPDVSLRGIENYAVGVAKLFDATSRCEVIRCVAVDDATIAVSWRLSGGVKIGPGLAFKPYVVDTALTVADGLVVFQEDAFAIPSWQILLGALAPWLPVPAPAPPAAALRAELRVP